MKISGTAWTASVNVNAAYSTLKAIKFTNRHVLKSS